LHFAGRQEKNGVAVDNAPAGVAKQSAVGVAVEGDADVEVSLLADDSLIGSEAVIDVTRYHFWMQRAAILIDVLTVGACVEKSCFDF
jgi:phage terminase large subunit-like protein